MQLWWKADLSQQMNFFQFRIIFLTKYLIVRTMGPPIQGLACFWVRFGYFFRWQFQQDFPRNFNSGPGLADHPSKWPYFQNQLETIKAPQEIDNTDAAKIIRHTQRRKAWAEYWVGASRKVPSPHHHHLPPPAVHSFHQKCRPPQSAAPGHFSPPPPFSGPWLAPDTLRSELPSADVDDAAENSDTIFTAPGGTEWLQITHGDFVVWTSCYCPLLGCTRSRGRCWAAIRLSQCFLSRFWVS